MDVIKGLIKIKNYSEVYHQLGDFFSYKHLVLQFW